MSILPFPRRTRIALVLAAFAAAAVASAGQVSIPFDVTFKGDYEMTDWYLPLTMPAADPSMGTLVGIDYSIDWKSKLDFAFKSVEGNGGAVDIAHSLNLDVYDAEYNTLFTSFHLDDRQYEGMVAPNDTLTFAPQMRSGTINGSVPSSALAFLPGTTLGITANSLLTGTGSGQFDQINNTFAGVKGIFTYNYQPVPEPGSVAALAVGALGLLRRRRQGGRK